jgi:hypothetical protein
MAFEAPEELGRLVREGDDDGQQDQNRLVLRDVAAPGVEECIELA